LQRIADSDFIPGIDLSLSDYIYVEIHISDYSLRYFLVRILISMPTSSASRSSLLT